VSGSLRQVEAVAFSQHYIALSYCAASMARIDASAPVLLVLSLLLQLRFVLLIIITVATLPVNQYSYHY
jgi:hypothetical protein